MSEKHTQTGAIAWMASHGVAPNILMLVFIFGGLYMSTQIKQEVFPSFSRDTVNVTVPLPGASPEEVEEGVVLAVEEAIRAVNGIAEISSTASEGRGRVQIEILSGYDLQQVAQDVKQAVDRIDTFPEDAREESIAVSSRRRAVIDMQLFGRVDEVSLRNAAELMRDGLLQHPKITQVDFRGDREMEIHIEIPQSTLREYGLSLTDVSRIVGNAALDRSGGSIETKAGEILLRVQERRDWAHEYENIPIITSSSGEVVRLDDIAVIREGFEESNTVATFNGMRSIELSIMRVGDQTPIGISTAVHEALPSVIAALPPGIEYSIVDDDSEAYRQRLTLLLRNGFIGLCLVLTILSLFLEFRLAFWVAMGIPTSFLGALLFLPFFDASINMVSMFAFILALGIVVDDAIVAGENIHEARQRGESPLDAAIIGARGISIPITFSILTNIVAFIPLALIPGTFGKIWFVIPVVVSTTFAISWVEALFILPRHLSHITERKEVKNKGKFRRLQDFFAGSMHTFANRVYKPFLGIALQWRYLTIALICSSLILILAIPFTGRMGFMLMPRVEGEYAQASARLPVGAPMQTVEHVRNRLVRSAETVMKMNGGDSLGMGVFGLIRENSVEVRAHLIEASKRTMSTSEFTRLWREELGGPIPDAQMVRFASESGGPSRGAGLSIELAHRDVAILERAAKELARELESFASIKDVDDGYIPGKEQLDFKVNEEGRTLGLTAVSIARQVRANYYGDEPIRQQRGRNEVTVKIRRPEEERTKEADLENLILQTPDGGEVPLYQVASVKRGRAYRTIARRNGSRVIEVSANVEPRTEVTKVLGSAVSDVLPVLIANYPGLRYSFEGRQADMRDSIQSFYYTCSIALVLIYVLLAIPFRSYLQPLIVMTSIPFAIVGAVIGHMIMGFSLSMISVMGIIALSGVVINDGLVMLDYTNKQRQEGLSALEAIKIAGVRRFRPIILTTVTTFGGLAPMIFENSRQARFLIPMALSLGYGILFATFITLLLVPSLYLVTEDIKHGASKIGRILFSKKSTDAVIPQPDRTS